MALYFSYCFSYYWASGASSSAHTHLRVVVLLRCASFALSALQLRTGYPPPAGYMNGTGRHTMVFMRRVSSLSGLAYQIFAAIPFVYELRQLLDWSCTPTTLTFMDWLKLEDINTSLFLVAVMRQSRAHKPRGARQPRYMKFFQGALLFSLLLVLLWVPLLVFSSGNPTYQAPHVVRFGVNASLESMGKDGSVAIFDVYSAGQRRIARQWTFDNASLPSDLQFLPEQIQLLCVSQVRSRRDDEES